MFFIDGVAVASVLFLAVTLYFDACFGPFCPQGRSFAMKPPFSSGGVLSYIATAAVPGASDDTTAPRRSNYSLCENDRLLGPAHSDHAEISELGGGRFSHWGSGLIFSTSDNSDPNTNGRTYRLVE